MSTQGHKKKKVAWYLQKTQSFSIISSWSEGNLWNAQNKIQNNDCKENQYKIREYKWIEEMRESMSDMKANIILKR